MNVAIEKLRLVSLTDKVRVREQAWFASRWNLVLPLKGRWDQVAEEVAHMHHQQVLRSAIQSWGVPADQRSAVSKNKTQVTLDAYIVKKEKQSQTGERRKEKATLPLKEHVTVPALRFGSERRFGIHYGLAKYRNLLDMANVRKAISVSPPAQAAPANQPLRQSIVSSFFEIHGVYADCIPAPGYRSHVPDSVKPIFQPFSDELNRLKATRVRPLSLVTECSGTYFVPAQTAG